MTATRPRTAGWIGLAAFLIFALSAGGRIVGSDEVTMFELARSLMRGSVAVPEGATLRGPDGLAYTKNAAGEAVLALPLVALGETVARAAGVAPEKRELGVRFVASFFNAIVCAVLLAVTYAAARALGTGPLAALAAVALLGFTTPLWVSAKGFMAEPLQALGLVLAVSGNALAASPSWRRAGALGALLAVSVKGSMLPFALAALLAFRGQPWRRAVPALVALALAVGGHLLYNVARFGTALETGYGAQATTAAYTTPLWVGLYGLVLSSGKGIVWYAPAVILALVGWREGFTRAADPPRDSVSMVARASVLLWILALLLYGTFEHWAGDGSFGPRYLVPFLPLAFLAVARALDRATPPVRRLAGTLGLLGLLVQVGGIGIYYGAQMRDAGDYPYTRPMNDPRFMSDSHFNPAHSPIVHHWRLLARNAAEHATGQAPVLRGGADVDPRLGITPDDRDRLLHAIDLWWISAGYVGVPGVFRFGALLVIVLAAAWAGTRALAAARAEAGRA